MKRKTRNRILALALAVVLCTSGLITGGSLTTQAAVIQNGLPTIRVSTTTTTNPTVVGFGGKQWVVIGYNGTGVNSEAGTMTLLLNKDVDHTQNIYGSTIYYSGDPTSDIWADPTANHYDISLLKPAMETAANALPAGEKALITPVDLEGGSTNAEGVINDDKMGGANVNAQLFWPLSVSEAKAIHLNERVFWGTWWLRSAGHRTLELANVWGRDGNVHIEGDGVDGIGGIRPALKINLTSVIFTSSAASSGGKPTIVGANLSAAQPPTAEIKLTVKDPSTANLNLVVEPADRAPKTAVQGEKITIPYSGAVVDTNKYVSCVIENSGGIKYYAKLAGTASGDATINIPTTMPAGSYTIKLFNEQCNPDNYTDFASDPISIPLTVRALVSPTINGSATGTDSITVIEGYATHTKAYTIAGIPAPTMTIADDGTGASVTNAGVLNIPAGLNKGNYTIVITASNGELPNATMTVSLNVLETPRVPTVTPTSLAMQEGTTESFAVAMGTGTDKADSVSIVSDDMAVATVDQSALTANGTVTVTAVTEGTTNITLTWTGGGKNGTTTAVAVTVTKTPPPPVANYTITLSTSGDGTVTGGRIYAESDTATVTATANAGSSFKQWTEGGTAVSTSASYSFIVTANRSLTAEFMVLPPNSYGVTFDPAGGTLISGSLNQVVASGAGAIAPVLDRSGYTFDGWDKDFSSITANLTVTAQWKQIPPAGINHTITLGASGDGTVTGGGTFNENSNITVTATANAGSVFVNWTENGVGVSTSASYSFVVTAARTLVANFKADDAPEPPIDPPIDPPTTPSYSGGSSSSGGSSKADTSPVVQTGRAFTKPEATKHFNAALAAKAEGQTSLSFRARNYTSVDKTVLAELAALAKKNGVTLTVHFDTVVGKAVTYRMSVNPAGITTNLDLTAKIVGVKITLPKFSPAVEIAVKMPAGITIGNLKITQNGKLVANAKPWLDKSGYLHFTTTGGEIVLGK